MDRRKSEQVEEIRKRTWAEISLDNMEHNYRAIRALLGPGCRFLGVVKADGYGHGAVEISRRLEELGADYLAVSNMDEALQIRHAGIRMPLLILGYTPEECACELLEQDITQTIYDAETARAFSRAAAALGRRLRVHFKLDTGMSRLGFLCGEEELERTAAAVAELARLPGLEPEGIFTHFAAADDAGEEEYTRLQFDRFMSALGLLREKYGLAFPIRHCASSGAVLNYPWTHLDMVRPGLLLYGVVPSPELTEKISLRPVMTLKTVISSLKELEGGVTVSYGRTYRTERKRLVAVVPVGYADGLQRVLSNRYSVLLRGKRVPITGRICMDMTMLDVTGVPGVQVGDEIEVFGERVPVTEAAELAGTIPYELVCGISKRVPRLYFQQGERRAAFLGMN